MRKRMLYVVVLALITALLASATGCHGTWVTGSGNLETRELDYTGFSTVTHE